MLVFSFAAGVQNPFYPFFLLNQTFSPIEPAAFEAEDVIIKSCRGNDNKNPTTVKNNTKNIEYDWEQNT